MNLLNPISKNQIQALITKKPGDKKIGETILTVGEDWQDDLRKSFAQFVIVNLQEDIGTKAAGFVFNTKNTFSSTLKQFVNFQDNLYLHGGDFLVLGSANFLDVEKRLQSFDLSKEEQFEAVKEIDQIVYEIIKIIFESGKVPIIIGGGQNNAYPIIQALSEVQEQAVNCINIAAHTSLRPPEGRHARNGFSFALTEGYLEKYYAFGLQESEIPHSIYEFILANYNQIGFTRFEAILKNDPYLFEAIQEANEFTEDGYLGLEVNVNSISGILISPDHPDGFLLREVRQLIRKVCTFHQPSYLHICEANAGEKNSKESMVVGKSIALLVADFIKSFNQSIIDEEE